MALTDSLISHWKLNEASGTRDDSHSTNHLSDNNTVTSATGKVGDAGDFEAMNTEFLSLSDNAAMSTGATSFTFACWVQLESTGSENFSTILSKDTVASGHREYNLIYEKVANRFSFSAGRTGSTTVDSAIANNFGAPSLATWYFIVAWYDRDLDTVNIQVNNGTANSAAKTIDPPDGTGSFFIGKLGNNQFYWDGLIDSVSFWKRVLTSDEKTQLYNSGNGLDYDSFGSGTTAVGNTRQLLWSLNETEASTRQVLFNVGKAVGNSRSASWDVSDATGNSRTLSWNASDAVGNNRDLLWDTRKAIAANNRDILFNILAPIGSQRSVLFNTSANTGSTRQVRWSVTVPVTGPARICVWNVGKSTGNSRQVLWNSESPVGTNRAMYWATDSHLGSGSSLSSAKAIRLRRRLHRFLKV